MLLFTMSEPSPGAVEDRNRHIDRLLLRMGEGDNEAFRGLYDEINTDIFGFAMSIVRDPREAEDIAHDAFLRIWQSAAGYKSAGKPMAWVLTVVRNLALMRIREQGRVSDTTAEEALLYIADTRQLDGEDKQMLRAALEKLSPEEFQIVTLHAVSGFEHREIGRMLGVPDATVRTRYRRALMKLRAFLEEVSA